MESILRTIIETLKRDEGFRPHAYQDSLGFWTIGYGILIDARRGGGIDQIEAEYLLRNRVIRVIQELSDHEFFLRCNERRQVVLINMAYNLGIAGLLQFRKMIAAIEAGDWETASKEILNSMIAVQAPSRYERLAREILDLPDQNLEAALWGEK